MEQTTKLILMIVLTSTYFVVELVTGYITKSNALIADSFHMLSDVIALFIALIAIRMAKRESKHNTFGWIRAETMGALMNSVFLIALCFTIFTDAIQRLVKPEQIEEIVFVIVVGSVGLLVNIIGMVMFWGGHGGHHHHHHHHSHHDEKHAQNDAKEPSPSLSTTNSYVMPVSPSPMSKYPERALNEIVIQLQEEQQDNHDTADHQVRIKDHEAKKTRKRNLNIQGVFLHILADALGSVVVLISGVIVFVVTDGNKKDVTWTKYIDPILSILLVVLIVASTSSLLKESAHILLQNAPAHLDARKLQEELLVNVPEIREVHDFHVWQLNNDKVIGSAHVKRTNLSDYMNVSDKIKTFFHNHGIHSTTIQIEHDEVAGDNADADNANDDQCLLSCPTTDGCISQTCCGQNQRRNTIATVLP